MDPHAERMAALVICQPCATGADYLTDLRTGRILTAWRGTAAPPDEVARRWHDDCTGCDCQHRINLPAADDDRVHEARSGAGRA